MVTVAGILMESACFFEHLVLHIAIRREGQLEARHIYHTVVDAVLQGAVYKMRFYKVLLVLGFLIPQALPMSSELPFYGRLQA